MVIFALQASGSRLNPVLDGDTCGEWLQLTIPLKRVGNLFFIEARVDSVTGNFLLDTGAPGLVLNQTYFRNTMMGDGQLASGIGKSQSRVMRFLADTLAIGELIYENMTADVVALGHLENSLGIKVTGLLGTGLFYNLEMELDTRNKTLTLYKTGLQGNRLQHKDTADIPEIEMPLQIVNNVWMIEGKINGRKLKFVFDTGAEVNVLDDAVPGKVLELFSLTTRKVISGSTAAKLEVLNGQISAFELGSVTFEDQPFIIADLSHLQLAYGINIDGILGYDIISGSRIVLNAKQKTCIMYLN